MSKDSKQFPTRLTVMSLIIVMGTLFSFQPAGAVGMNHQHDDENGNPRDQDRNQQSRHDCDPQTDPNCEHEDDQAVAQQRQDHNQEREQQNQRDQDQQNQDQRDQQQRDREQRDRDQQNPDQSCEPRNDENCVCRVEDENGQNEDNQPQDQQRRDQEQNQNQQQDQQRQTQAAAHQDQHQDEYMDISSFYFDSGWVAVQSNTSYMFNHNFGDLPSYVVIHQCGKLDENKKCVGEAVIAGERGYQDGVTAINPMMVTSTKDALKVVLGNFWAWGTWNAQTGWQCPDDEDNNCNTAYYRIQAFK